MNTPLADQGSVQVSAIIPSFLFGTVEPYHRANVEFSPKLNSLFPIYLGSGTGQGKCTLVDGEATRGNDECRCPRLITVVAFLTVFCSW